MHSAGLLALRLSTGLLFAAHGFPKLFGGRGTAVPPLAQRYLGEGFVRAMERGGIANFAGGLERMGVPAPRHMAVVVGLTEFVGGVLLVAGFATRLTAAALAINMVFAIKLAHWKQGLIGAASGYMYALSMLGGMLAVAGSGAGALSLDRRVARRLARRRERSTRRPCEVGRPSGGSGCGSLGALPVRGHRVPEVEGASLSCNGAHPW